MARRYFFGNITTDWIYDSEGRLSTKTQTIGTVSKSISYSYDPTTGRLATITYPSNTVVSYTYDKAGRVASLSVSSAKILDNILYRPFGAVKSYQLSAVTGSPTISRGYNANGQLVSYSLGNVNKVLQRDRLGNVTGLRNAAATTWDSVYTYDALNRLTDLTIASVSQNYHYGYDSLGNRLGKSANGGGTTYTYNPANNRLATVNGVTQSYDAAGNLTGNGSTTWTYNARGRLVSAKLANATVYNYGINGLGQRVSKSGTAVSTGRQIYVYDEAGHLIGEYNNSGARLWEHVYLGDLPVAVIGSAGGVFPVLSDHLGTPRQVINAAKQLRWKWDNTEPFGANVANQNPANLGVFAYNLRFSGQYFDAETGLHYNMFRDFNPQTGRYIESDPIGLEGGLNTYGYVGGNPLRFVDPLGLLPDCFRGVPRVTITTDTKIEEKEVRKFRLLQPENYGITTGGNAPSLSMPIGPELAMDWYMWEHTLNEFNEFKITKNVKITTIWCEDKVDCGETIRFHYDEKTEKVDRRLVDHYQKWLSRKLYKVARNSFGLP